MNISETGKAPHYEEIIREILSSAKGPITTENLAAHILQRRPSKARNPHQVALTKIREMVGRQLVYIGAT